MLIYGTIFPSCPINKKIAGNKLNHFLRNRASGKNALSNTVCLSHF